MSKCICCGEEIGNVSVCPICGTAVKKRTAPAPTPNKTTEQPVTGSGSLLEQIEQSKTDLIESCATAVTKIIVEGNGYISTGTGWCGHKNIVITNAHVIEAHDNDRKYETNIVCEFSNKLNLGSKQKMAMNVLLYSRNEDIAILTPKSGDIPSEVKILDISPIETKQGEMVFTIGNPLHYKFTYTEGVVANPHYNNSHKGGKYDSLQTTLTLNSGNSGGPVFNIHGGVVGMATYSELTKEHDDLVDAVSALTGDSSLESASYKEIAGYGFCVTSEAILNAIDSIKNRL